MSPPLATSFHIEKVIEVTAARSWLWDLVEAKDAILLVAVSDVVAGLWSDGGLVGLGSAW